MAAYPHMIFASEKAELTKERLAEVATSVLDGATSETSALKVVVTRDGYPFTFWFEDADRVGEMYVDYLPEGARRRPVMNATTVVDMSGAADPSDEHADEAHAIVTALAALDGVNVFREATKRFVGYDYGDGAAAPSPATPVDAMPHAPTQPAPAAQHEHATSGDTPRSQPTPTPVPDPLAPAAHVEPPTPSTPAQPHTPVEPLTPEPATPETVVIEPAVPEVRVRVEPVETPQPAWAPEPVVTSVKAPEPVAPPAAARPVEPAVTEPAVAPEPVAPAPIPDAPQPDAEALDTLDTTASPIEPPAPIDEPEPIPAPTPEPEGGFFKRLFGRKR